MSIRAQILVWRTGDLRIRIDKRRGNVLKKDIY